jgi:predicted kinase
MVAQVASLDELGERLRGLAAGTSKPIRLFPIGAQGSGKSFLGAQLKERLAEFEVVSPDDTRMDLYRAAHPGEIVDYRSLRGFLTPGRQRAVFQSVLQRFHESPSRFVYLDQMNLTPSARAPFLRPENFNVAIVLRASVETILERHRQRPDKAEEIPTEAVISSVRRLEAPTEDEFDLVISYEAG